MNKLFKIALVFIAMPTFVGCSNGVYNTEPGQQEVGVGGQVATGLAAAVIQSALHGSSGYGGYGRVDEFDKRDAWSDGQGLYDAGAPPSACRAAGDPELVSACRSGGRFRQTQEGIGRYHTCLNRGGSQDYCRSLQ